MTDEEAIEMQDNTEREDALRAPAQIPDETVNITEAFDEAASEEYKAGYDAGFAAGVNHCSQMTPPSFGKENKEQP